MKTKRLEVLSISILIICLTLTMYGQKSKHNIYFYAGFAQGKPDLRYDFLYDQYVAEISEIVKSKIGNVTKDDEYFLGISYNYQVVNRLNFGIGLGYAQLKQDFFLPANGKFFEQKIYPFFWRDYSRYHMVQISPEIRLDLVNYKTLSLGINTRITSNFSFRKEIEWQDLSINKTEYFATELYPGVHLRIGQFCIELNKRVQHWKYRDDAIANNGLSVDTYNPSKWRFQISYEFWRSKKKE